MRSSLILFLVAAHFFEPASLLTHFKANRHELSEIDGHTTKEIGLENGVMVSIEKDESYGAIYLRLGRLFNRVDHLRLDADTVFNVGSYIFYKRFASICEVLISPDDLSYSMLEVPIPGLEKLEQVNGTIIRCTIEGKQEEFDITDLVRAKPNPGQKYTEVEFSALQRIRD